MPPSSASASTGSTASASNGTLLFVSHSPAEVRRLCNRAIWIEDGRIRSQGDPSVVIRAYHRALAMEKDDIHRFSVSE